MDKIGLVGRWAEIIIVETLSMGYLEEKVSYYPAPIPDAFPADTGFQKHSTRSFYVLLCHLFHLHCYEWFSHPVDHQMMVGSAQD